MNQSDENNVEKLADFVNQNSNTKSPIKNIVNYLVRETNKNKFNYGQLNYIFKSIRERCEIEVPSNKRKLYELPTNNEVTSFYSAIDNPIHKLIFETLEGTGLRIGKLCELEIEKIDFDNNVMFIKNAKGGNDRIVPFGNKLKYKLSIYLSNRNNRYLFESNRNSKFSTRRVEQLCKKYLLKSEIVTLITPHTFRHLYNTHLANNKISKEIRMMLVGHKSEKTQDIYTHLSLGGHKQEIIKVLDNNQ